MVSRRNPLGIGVLGAALFTTGAAGLEGQQPVDKNPPKAAKDETSKIRVEAAIGEIGRDLKEIVKAKYTPKEGEIAKLIEQLGDEEFSKREDAFDKLIRTGTLANDALTEALKSAVLEIEKRAGTIREEIPVINKKAAEKLQVPVTRFADIKAKAPDVNVALKEEDAKYLTRLLAEDHKDLKLVLLQYLGIRGPEVKELAPIVSADLKHPDRDIRQRAGLTLGRMGADPKMGVPAAIDALKSDRPEIRKEAADILGQYGKEAKAATDDLRKALIDESPSVRKSATEALVKVGVETKVMVEGAVAALKSDRSEVRKEALELIWSYGADAKAGATVSVVNALKDSEPGIRKLAAETLVKIEVEPRVIVEGAIDGLKDGNYYGVRKDAIELIGKYRPEVTKIAVLPLIKTLTSEDPIDKSAAMKVFLKMGALARPVIVHLEGLAHNEKESPELRAEAEQTILGIEEAVKAAKKAHSP